MEVYMVSKSKTNAILIEMEYWKGNVETELAALEKLTAAEFEQLDKRALNHIRQMNTNIGNLICKFDNLLKEEPVSLEDLDEKLDNHEKYFHDAE